MASAAPTPLASEIPTQYAQQLPLVDDIWLDHVLTFTSVFTILIFKQVCRKSRALAHDALLVRLTRMVGTFVPERYSLMSLFADEALVIGGSFALWFLSLEDRRLPFQPESLDLFTNEASYPKVVSHMTTSQRFTLLFEERCDPNGQDENSAVFGQGVVQRACFTRPGNERAVYVMRSEGKSPFLPISQSWSTLLMNAVTPYALYCAYPRLLQNRRYLFRFRSLNYDPSSPDHLVALGMKEDDYDARGFTGIPSSSRARSMLTFQEQRRTAPRALRSFMDKDTLRIHFDVGGQTAEKRNHTGDVVWRLGGHMGKRRYVRAACEIAATTSRKGIFKV